MLEAGADLRWVKDQLGHASIEETEETYVHLERERHERRVDLDSVLRIGSGASTGVHASDAGAAIGGQLRDFSREDFMVEGKGFQPTGINYFTDLRGTSVVKYGHFGTILGPLLGPHDKPPRFHRPVT